MHDSPGQIIQQRPCPSAQTELAKVSLLKAKRICDVIVKLYKTNTVNPVFNTGYDGTGVIYDDEYDKDKLV